MKKCHPYKLRNTITVPVTPYKTLFDDNTFTIRKGEIIIFMFITEATLIDRNRHIGMMYKGGFYTAPFQFDAEHEIEAYYFEEIA